MALVKLQFTPQQPTALPPFEVMFNPNSYSITKTVAWTQQSSGASTAAVSTHRELDAPPLVFGGGAPRVLSLQLFFDVTEGPVKDVRAITNQLVALTRIESGLTQPRPPVVQLSWGAFPTGSDFPFVGVVTNLQQSFVLFSSAGEPLRANLTLAITEYIDAEQNLKHTDPDLTTYTVKRGDTLSSIAATMYGSPALWRLIADANRLDDPRSLSVGTRLAIPEKS